MHYGDYAREDDIEMVDFEKDMSAKVISYGNDRSTFDAKGQHYL